jgi:hypothetical protein
MRSRRNSTPCRSEPADAPLALGEAVRRCRRDATFLAALRDIYRQADLMLGLVPLDACHPQAFPSVGVIGASTAPPSKRRLKAAHLPGDRSVCRACGKCCKFDLTGDRLYVSTGELALLCKVPPPKPGLVRVLRCPYQVGRRCTARDRRPLGCRTFLCQKSSAPPRQEIYETHHRAIRRLHRRCNLPYRYVELTAALAELFPPPELHP